MNYSTFLQLTLFFWPGGDTPFVLWELAYCTGIHCTQPSESAWYCRYTMQERTNSIQLL